MKEIVEELKIEKPKNKKHGSISIKDVTLIALFAALMAVCSWISIPFVVPFTLQTFAVFLALITLGGFKGTLSILTYILLGVIGLPVFASFNGGVAYIAGPTGGYIVGFLLTGLFMWAVEKPFASKNDGFLVISMLIGLLICYICGTIWFWVVYSGRGNDTDILNILLMCVLPFIVPDVLKIVLALFIKNKLKRFIK